MNSLLSFHFFSKLKSDLVSLIYTGEFDDELTSTLMKVNETSIDDSGKFSKKLSYLLAECFQNIIRHGEKPIIVNRTNNKPKMFAIRCTKDVFHIASSNLINNTKKDGLHQTLKKLNTYSKEELKATYMNAFTNNEFSEKGGGGLGLIEMARKSDYPIQYDFEFVNFYFSNFFMQLSILAKNAPKDQKADTIDLKSTVQLYKEIVDENLLMIRKGDFSQQTILPILELLRANIDGKEKKQASSKKIAYILIELLQNISKHGSSFNGIHEGIFIIALKDNKYNIQTGNYVDVGDVENLKKNLDTYSNMDEKGLTWAYRNNLMSQEPKEKGNAGIGLIEICKYSSEKMVYDFKPISDKVSFFSLRVTI